jgi:hypothetical protein
MKPDVVVHADNPATQKVQVRQWKVRGQPGVYEFQASLGYIMKTVLSKKQQKQTKT